MNQSDKINIRPGVSILSALKHLNYKPHYAIAEFIDNAIDSFLKNENELKKIRGDDFRLTVHIEFDTTNDKITIIDNAAGIHTNDYQRAFKTAEIPPDNTKLSEFGMGMKSAACWFTNKWQVRTTALGETIERQINFDVEKIVNDTLNELDVKTKEVSENSHYTIVTLSELNKKMPVKNGLSIVKKHLASIYRHFIRENIVHICISSRGGKDILKYKLPKILKSRPHFETENKKSILWTQNIDFDFGVNEKGATLRATGFVALLETMSVKQSGFALFRRNRVIVGSADEGFKPLRISGSIGSHRYKRLFGELHLEGFKVSHTKDGFQWDDNLEVFLEFLEEELKGKDSIPILKQADKYRVRESSTNYEKVSKKVVGNTAKNIKDGLDNDIKKVIAKPLSNDLVSPLVAVRKSYFEKFQLQLDNQDFTVHIELSYDESIDELFQVGNHLVPAGISSIGQKDIGVRLSLVHPFMVQFAGDDKKVIEPILRIAVALGLSEMIAKITKSPPSEVRKSMNELLKGSLSNA